MYVFGRIACLLGLGATAIGAPAFAQSAISGDSLAFRSTNSNVIGTTGYVGTYLTVPDSGDGGAVVNLTLNATRGSGS
jgi:hypothetical protein